MTNLKIQGRFCYKFVSIWTKLLHPKVQGLDYYKFESTRSKSLQTKVLGLNYYFYEIFYEIFGTKTDFNPNETTFSSMVGRSFICTQNKQGRED